ncbi:MAG: copper-binding protein [Ottowia sp.]|uniref:copper-binding protein n=1 Tax=unclassified Ottowia TaxID=2645081 RepID=UPI003C2B4D8F
MNSLKQFLSVSAVAMGLALPLSGFAQADAAAPKADASSQQMSMTDGEIRKVDLDNGKVTIKHGEIKHMDMPGMTMVFTARDKSLLSNVKPGDKVKFMVVHENGKMIVTDIQPAQ